MEKKNISDGDLSLENVGYVVLPEQQNHPNRDRALYPVPSMETKRFFGMLDTFSTRAVHRIIAETFLSNTGNQNAVNHKDHDKTNNRVSNLAPW